MAAYAVTGASGHVGRFAVQHLLARGVPASDVIAVVRTKGKAADLAAQGVGVREADYSRPGTMAAALARVDRLHRDTERVLRNARMSFTLLRNGYYTEVYTDPLEQYLAAGEIVGAAGNGKISAATRENYAAAAAAALLHDDEGNRTYELGGPAFGLPQLTQVLSEITGTKVGYRHLPAAEYASWLQETGLDGPAYARLPLDRRSRD